MKKFDPGVELAVATTVVLAKPCGLASIIVTGNGTNLASIKIYDHAASATGSVIKALANKQCAVYTPAKSDSLANGCVAVVAGTGAKGYVSVEA